MRHTPSLITRLVGAALGVVVGVGFIAVAGGVVSPNDVAALQTVRLDPVTIVADPGIDAERMTLACTPAIKTL